MTKSILLKVSTAILIGLSSLHAQNEGDVDAIEKARQAKEAADKIRQKGRSRPVHFRLVGRCVMNNITASYLQQFLVQNNMYARIGQKLYLITIELF